MDDRGPEILETMRGDARQAIAWAADAGADWISEAKTVAMAAMRKRICYDHGRLDLAVLQETVRRDLPVLLRRLNAISR